MFARLTHSGTITFSTKLAIFDNVREGFCDTVSHTENQPKYAQFQSVGIKDKLVAPPMHAPSRTPLLLPLLLSHNLPTPRVR